MNEFLPISYSEKYVFYSYLISVLGCFIGLIASSRIVIRPGKISRANAISAGLGIGGVGIWSMHFMGMLAVNFDLAKGYAVIETLGSLLAAVVTTTFALIYALKNKNDLSKIWLAGFMLGFGICVMHYLGMYGMRFAGYFRWDLRYVVLSVLIAIGAATAALYIATRAKNSIHRMFAALAMGLAVCAMHYTGMYAADVICTTTNRGSYPQGFGIIMSGYLPLLLLLTTAGLLLVISADQLSQTTNTKPNLPKAIKRRSSKPRAPQVAPAPLASTQSPSN